jgi:hypothetical protein
MLKVAVGLMANIHRFVSELLNRFKYNLKQYKYMLQFRIITKRKLRRYEFNTQTTFTRSPCNVECFLFLRR